MEIQRKKELLKSLISDYCKKKGISKADFAVKAKVSPATLSAIEKGQLEKISENMANKLYSVVVSEQTAALYNTTDLQAIEQACEFAKSRHFMVGIIGDTGVGKTTGLKAYASSHANVVRVTLQKNMHIKQLLRSMLAELGLSFSGSYYEMLEKISEEFNSRTAPLLIIDEAGKMSNSIMLTLHDLREATAANLGIVLAGMPYFKTNLTKLAQREKIGYAEFLRRVNIWNKLNGLTEAEKAVIAEDNGLEVSDIQTLTLSNRFGDVANAIELLKIERYGNSF